MNKSFALTTYTKEVTFDMHFRNYETYIWVLYMQLHYESQ